MDDKFHREFLKGVITHSCQILTSLQFQYIAVEIEVRMCNYSPLIRSDVITYQWRYSEPGLANVC